MRKVVLTLVLSLLKAFFNFVPELLLFLTFVVFRLFDVGKVWIEEVVGVEWEEWFIFFVVDSEVEVEAEGSEHGFFIMKKVGVFIEEATFWYKVIFVAIFPGTIVLYQRILVFFFTL